MVEVWNNFRNTISLNRPFSKIRVQLPDTVSVVHAYYESYSSAGQNFVVVSPY